MKYNRLIAGVTSFALMFGCFAGTSKTVKAYDGDNIQPWERSAETHRDNLKGSIGYLKALDVSAYTEKTVEDLNSAIAEAEAVAEKDGQSKETYWQARTKLEHARANLLVKNIGENAGSIVPFRELTKEQLIDEMGTGINLGNTLDGHSSMTPGELVWQGVPTTKNIIKSMHDSGYNTLRVPVTWGNMIEKDETTGKYSVNDKWMKRVQEIVDYGISQDMYIILNVHHDGVNWNNGWFNIGHNDIDEVMEKYAALWTIIGERFKDYDEHLIFESFNEMTCSVTEKEMWDGNAQNYDRDILHNFNQLFVNTVRGTGGNNTKRWLASAGHFASSAKIDMPDDPLNEGTSHQIFAAHIYNSISNLLSELDNMARDFDCAMYLGEWSTYLSRDGRTDSGYNDVGIAYDNQRVNRACKINGICPIVWNCGMYTESDGTLQLGGSQYWNRADEKPVFDQIIDGVMRGSYLDPYELEVESQYDSNKTHVINTDIEQITCADTINMTIGEIAHADVSVSPDVNNDVLVWQTDNDSVVTVSNGRLRAKGAGDATVTVYAQNSVDFGNYPDYTENPYEHAVKKEIKVHVDYNANGMQEAAVPASVTIEQGQAVMPQISVAGSDYITYSSADEKIASVGCMGTIFGNSVGETNVTMTLSSGVKKSFTVKVIPETRARKMNVALFLYYNDSTHNYYGDEIGIPVTIDQDGTYTVSFDVDENMSERGAQENITTINHVGSIYVKDYDVYKGKILDSNTNSATITWKEIKINGEAVSLTENGKEPFDAMQNGILDTGNPVNTWSGSVIEGITLAAENEAVFAQENPHRIDVTFEISGLDWKSEEIIPDTGTSDQDIPGNPPAVSTPPASTPTVNPPVVNTPVPTNNNEQVSDSGTKKPEKVTKVKAKASKKGITVSWKKIKCKGYQVAYATSKKALKKKTVKSSSTSKNKITLKKLKKGKAYYIKVRAYDQAGKGKVYGKYSKVVKVG